MASGGDLNAAREAFVARQPMGRFGTPEEIAQAALYLASDASSFMYSHLSPTHNQGVVDRISSTFRQKTPSATQTATR